MEKFINGEIVECFSLNYFFKILDMHGRSDIGVVEVMLIILFVDGNNFSNFFIYEAK